MGRGESSVEDENLAEKLYNEYIGFRRKIIGTNDLLKKYMLFIGFLNNWFIENDLGYIVVTGGFAVEVFTGQAYRTMDVDLIASNSRVAKILELFLEK